MRKNEHGERVLAFPLWALVLLAGVWRAVRRRRSA